MGKKRHEGRIVAECRRRGGRPSAVHQEHDLLKGEETDAQRQRDSHGAGIGQDDMQEEIGIFEPAQQQQIGQHPSRQPRARGTAAPQSAPDRVIAGDRGDQDRGLRRIPPGVEHQIGRDQPPQRPSAPRQPSGGEEAADTHRHEAENERDAVEHHVRRPRRFGWWGNRHLDGNATTVVRKS
ncbi:hypothetical protein GALL_503500 [mine drainage metagenome]|uniref:Uncharacterized protein n=1 Tax=mine drainage metagenome TaxID=410659 RepID=A0A1J5P9U7_9ZZZZ